MSAKPGTPLPWSYWFDCDGDHAITDHAGKILAVTAGTPDLPREVDAANAAYLIHACNEHPALVEALRGLFNACKAQRAWEGGSKDFGPASPMGVAAATLARNGSPC